MSKSDDIKRNSHSIWLAGLGAWSMIEDQGSETFNELVSKGKAFEHLNQTRDIEVAPDSRLDELKSRANQTMDRIERAFDLRVSSTLGRLGISRRSDLKALHHKIDRLAEALDQVCADLDRKD
ncbi:MAG: phasin family protein [Pseudomonadota bacterium]|nr:poly(3-hydroxyalkanoate) granule-associated protein PhaI [Pseudomonadales bacterium]MDY6920705.1 phasin family protein [Pseudomonadota bacterium]